MIDIIQSETFKRWLSGLKDRRAAVRIYARLDRAACGNLGDVKPVGDGIAEMRIDHGPGYRVYFLQRGSMLIVLLVGGDKRSQAADIANAVKIAKDWKD
ncbi:MAG: type II toxin-antitoxin system RelE/ParE family toxin [Magnetococcales bacterium]|nr:type II toxin-antitoxin system RelE/ParE family toxin [Magnetococcales bacterium]